MDDREAVARLGKVFFDAYFVLDRERRIQDFNEGFVQLLGVRPSKRRTIQGSPCYDLLRLGICRKQCVALECLTKGMPVRKEEIKGTTVTNRDIVLELSSILLCNHAGEVSGVLVTHRDVTDERRLKTRYLEEQHRHKQERDTLLQKLKEQDLEIAALKTREKF